MLKNKRLLLVTLALVLAAVVVLGMKIAYPAHRLVAFILLGLGWIPLVISYQINRRLLRVQKHRLKKKARPFLPHTIVALILLAAFYVTWALFPVEKSPLTDLTPEEIRAEIAADLEAYTMLRETADDLADTFRKNGLLGRQVDTLTNLEKALLRNLWRDGVMTFLEFDLLKEKYRGFYQIDYVAEPALHSDAFMLACMAYVAQYDACLRIYEMIDGNGFMETLLNEPGEGIPADTVFNMKQRLTNPNVLLRFNAGAAYFELVKNDVTFSSELVDDFKARRKDFYERLNSNIDIFVENPLETLERAAFETLLPVQKNVAVQMSYIRTAKRDYLITPEILAEHRAKLQPGDILIQRRNWHMTNIGIPGFWPHVALYVGTPEECAAFLGEPPVVENNPVFEAWNQNDRDGFPNRVIEAIRPGVVFQSLETSAKCDYLAVIRPNLSTAEKQNAVRAAFSHYGKPYDLNFDFTTDNALVCSELVYKSYKPAEKLPLKPEIINGRRLLPPNRLAEQAVETMGENGAFSFVLFLDAVEKTDTVAVRDADAFKASYTRPKWDVMQK